MLASRVLRQSSRLAAVATPRAVVARSTRIAQPFRAFTDDSSKKDQHDLPGHNEEGQGSFSRTDKTIQVEHPTDEEYPPSKPVQGRGGMHFSRTLASFSLEGKVGVVTGGARGLGLVMAQALVISGADVALVDLNKDEGQKQADALMKHFEEENPGAEHIPRVTSHYSDVSNPESVQSCVNEIIEEHGKIDHLVTSAGFTENFDAIEYPHDRMKKLWGVNVDGSYLWTTAVARHLMDRKVKGSMVMVGSMSGAIVNVPQPQAPYNASKAAVRQLAASLAVEWAHAGIRVNTISPGYMLTALTQKIMDENPVLQQKWMSLIPQGKMGAPEDLMGAVVYLLSDAANYVTGADLRVDGGYTIT